MQPLGRGNDLDQDEYREHDEMFLNFVTMAIPIAAAVGIGRFVSWWLVLGLWALGDIVCIAPRWPLPPLADGRRPWWRITILSVAVLVFGTPTLVRSGLVRLFPKIIKL